MKGNTDCKVVVDLLPLSLDHLTSEQTEGWIQAHLSDCKKCRKEMERFVLQHKEQEQSQQEQDRRVLRTLKKWRYEMMGLLGAILFVVVGLVCFWVMNFIPTKENQEQTYSVKEHYEQVQDYGKQKYQGISPLALFPDAAALTGQVEEFYYDCKGQRLYQQYQIYLKCRYEEDAFQTEKQRLLDMTDKQTGRKTGYSEEENYLPCVYAMLYDEGFEYALLSEEEGTIIYIYLQGVDRREITFMKSYLPKDYGQAGYSFETEREAFRIYPTDWEVMYHEEKDE